LVNSFQGHVSGIRKIKQSPFSTNINTNYVATSSDDRSVKIWNAYSPFNWTLIRTYSEHTSEVYSLEWLDKDTLASAAKSEVLIKIWSHSSGQTKLTIITNRNVLSLAMLNNKIHLAAGLYGDIFIYNISNGNLVSSLIGQMNWVNDLVQISVDLLASSSNDQTVRLWNLTSSTCKTVLTGHGLKVFGLKHITSSILASGSVDKTIKVWNTATGQLIRTLTSHTGYIYQSVDLLNSQTLVSGSLDQTIKLWNWSTGECLSTIQANSQILSLAVIQMY
jgi:WD40 repeat protein